MNEGSTQTEMDLEFSEPIFSQVVDWIDPFLGLAALILIFIAARKFKHNNSLPYGSAIFWGVVCSVFFALAAGLVEIVEAFDYQTERNLSSFFYFLGSISAIWAAHGFLGIANHLKHED